MASGVEEDENGNLTFNPTQFAAGFLGGAIAGKAVSKGIEWRAKRSAKTYSNIAKDNPALMSEIAKRDLSHYAKSNVANGITRFLNKNKSLDINPQIIAGEKALLNEEYAPQKANLAKAKELHSKGVSEIDIWENTGWYLDKDSKWKFEINPRGGELVNSFGVFEASAMHGLRLEQILDDEALFKAYPQLKNLQININTDFISQGAAADVKGFYSSEDKSISMLNLKALGKKEFKSTLYHEIQHAVQDIEGFGFGEKIRDMSHYWVRHGEVEARNVERRLNRKFNVDDKAEARQRFIKDTFGKEGEKYVEIDNKMYEKYFEEKDIHITPSEEEFHNAFWEKHIKGGKLGDTPERYMFPHPHKTMDIRPSDTIAEVNIQGVAMSRELEESNSKEQKRLLRQYTKENLNKIKNKDIVNRANKEEIAARLSSVGIAKMSSDKAIQKSIDNGFSLLEHFEAINNIEKLFKNSIYLTSENAKNQSMDIKAVHRFVANNALKDKSAQALITLKESFKDGNRIYSLELEELKPTT